MNARFDDNNHIMLKESISSSHINFLFGAGVNGSAFPQLGGFTNTRKAIEESGGDVSKGIESSIDSIISPEVREKVKKTFTDELEHFSKSVDFSNESIKNIEALLRKIYSIINEAQNRNPSMKQINIYTLNYDEIVEKVLETLGYYYNTISSSRVGSLSKLTDIIGYDYNTKKYIPSFLISKLHGDIKSPILPGKEKYSDVLTPDYFEVAFNMKGNLCRNNSLLIVIGYSGGDEHINRLLQDCINVGLTILWYRFNPEESLPAVFCSNKQVIVIDQKNADDLEDTTKICHDDLEEVWVEK